MTLHVLKSIEFVGSSCLRFHNFLENFFACVFFSTRKKKTNSNEWAAPTQPVKVNDEKCSVTNELRSCYRYSFTFFYSSYSFEAYDSENTSESYIGKLPSDADQLRDFGRRTHSKNKNFSSSLSLSFSIASPSLSHYFYLNSTQKIPRR